MQYDCRFYSNCEAWENGKIKTGDTVVLAAFGSFTWEVLSKRSNF
jgi:3-oxoacyl-[acyl-carrier-protein] synthase III